MYEVHRRYVSKWITSLPISQPSCGKRLVAGWLLWGFLEGSSICGHLSDSGSEWRAGGVPDEYHILDNEWRIHGDADGDSYDYINKVNSSFSNESVQEEATAWPRLVEKYDDDDDDVRLAARHLQEIRMGKMDPQARKSRKLLSGHPELGAQEAMIREVGALPRYGVSPNGVVRVYGPHMMTQQPRSR